MSAAGARRASTHGQQHGAEAWHATRTWLLLAAFVGVQHCDGTVLISDCKQVLSWCCRAELNAEGGDGLAPGDDIVCVMDRIAVEVMKQRSR